MTTSKILVADTDELRAQCLQIRMDVFVTEQQVPPELEPDEYDNTATHFLLLVDNTPVGTARLVNKQGIAKIGRVAIVQSERGRGLGLGLMQAVLAHAQGENYGEAMLDSQTYAVPFYERLGFVAEGEEFDDAGIPHYLMRLNLKKY